VSLINARGPSSAEAAEAHARARDLCEKTGDADHLFVAIWGLWNFRRTSDLDAAGDLSDRLLTLVEKNDDVGLRLEAHHTGWTTHFFRGEPAPAQDHCEKAAVSTTLSGTGCMRKSTAMILGFARER
jgi:hypothetical protein